MSVASIPGHRRGPGRQRDRGRRVPGASTQYSSAGCRARGGGYLAAAAARSGTTFSPASGAHPCRSANRQPLTVAVLGELRKCGTSLSRFPRSSPPAVRSRQAWRRPPPPPRRPRRHAPSWHPVLSVTNTTERFCFRRRGDRQDDRVGVHQRRLRLRARRRHPRGSRSSSRAPAGPCGPRRRPRRRTCGPSSRPPATGRSLTTGTAGRGRWRRPSPAQHHRPVRAGDERRVGVRRVRHVR